MSGDKRIPQNLWSGEGPAPKTDVVLGQVADFLEKLGYGKTLKALKKEGDSNGVTIATDGPNEGEGLLDMWVRMAKEKEGSDGSDSDSSSESGSESDSESDDSDDDESDKENKMVDDEAEVTSDDSSDEESDKEELAALPAKAGQKRKRTESVSSSASSSSSEGLSSDSPDTGDEDSSSSESESESSSSSSEESDARPAKRAKVTKAKSPSDSSSVISSDSESESGSEGSVDTNSDDDSSDSSSSESSSDSETEDESNTAPPAKKPAPAKSSAEPAKVKTDTKARSGSTSSETIVADNEDDPTDTLVITDDLNTRMHPDRARRLPNATAENTLPATKENIKQLKKEHIPFQRVPTNTKVDPRFSSNAYVSYDYADRAHRDLIVTKGKGFTKEKNKKKRGSYRGGAIDVTPKGIKFDD